MNENRNEEVRTDNCLYIGSAQNYFVRPPPSYFIYWDRRSPGTCRVAVVLAVPTGFVAVQEYVPASSETEIGLYEKFVIFFFENLLFIISYSIFDFFFLWL